MPDLSKASVSEEEVSFRRTFEASGTRRNLAPYTDQLVDAPALYQLCLPTVKRSRTLPCLKISDKISVRFSPFFRTAYQEISAISKESQVRIVAIVDGIQLFLPSFTSGAWRSVRAVPSVPVI